jgi:predicted GH43/DUF377 family glycosyl hydrolase
MAEQHVPPVVERLNGGAPILQKIPAHPWENKVTFNPACALVEDRRTLDRIIRVLPFSARVRQSLRELDALCFLLYRAQGMKTGTTDYTHSSIGLAILSPTLELLARHDSPVILPDREYDDLGVEDARITQVDGRFIMLYTAYGSGAPKNRIRIALAGTEDFVHWEKHGLLKGDFNGIDNKNAMLFPSRVAGRHLLFHRPMEGEDAMAIHWAEAHDVMGSWKTKGLLMKANRNPSFIDTWIGGGAPPLRLSDGRFLILYHIGNRKGDGTREYDLGIAIGDPGRPGFIAKRVEPLLRPATLAETTGDADLGVNNVVFVCGAYFYRGDLYFPYAGADSVVLGANIRREEIEKFVSR